MGINSHRKWFQASIDMVKADEGNRRVDLGQVLERWRKYFQEIVHDTTLVLATDKQVQITLILKNFFPNFLLPISRFFFLSRNWFDSGLYGFFCKLRVRSL